MEAGKDSGVRLRLLDIVDTPISPELIPADENGNIKQKTEDLVGPYELHDFFLYYMLRFGFTPERIYLLARHAFTDEQHSCEDFSVNSSSVHVSLTARRWAPYAFRPEETGACPPTHRRHYGSCRDKIIHTSI